MIGSLIWGYFDFFIYSVDRTPKGVDFFAIYEAGHSGLEGRSVYEFNLDDIANGVTKSPYLSPYRYVPVFAYAVGAPLNALSPWRAYWAWVALNELLLVLNAYVTWRMAEQKTWGTVGVAMWLLFTPFYLELYLGQFSFLMTTALLWTGIGLLRGRELLAAVPWALSLVTKTNSAVLAPVFLRLGWWRALLGGCALLAANGAYFLWRPGDLRTFLDDNFLASFRKPPIRFNEYWPAQHGLTDLIENTYLAVDMTARQTPEAYSLIAVAVIVAVSLAVTFLARRQDLLALFAIWSSAFFLAYNDVWEFHYVMLLPALVLLVTHRPAFRPLVLAVFVPLALPAPHWLLTHVLNDQPLPVGPFLIDRLQTLWPAWGVVLYHAWKPIPTLVLWATLVASQSRGGFGLEWFASLGAPLRNRLVPRAE
ncbi:MAG: glycosyltransferase family 87 protein [Dehalococcoidia bacterium]